MKKKRALGFELRWEQSTSSNIYQKCDQRTFYFKAIEIPGF